MVIGIKTLTYSASFFEDEDEQEEEPGKFEKWLLNKFGEKAEKIVMGFTVCLSIVIAVALFMILPLFIADVIEKYVPRVHANAIVHIRNPHPKTTLRLIREKPRHRTQVRPVWHSSE
jgi:uncharacterized protein YqhQ